MCGAQSCAHLQACAQDLGSVDNILVDTGASHHIVNEKRYFVKMYHSSVATVTCGGVEEHAVQGAGTVVLQGTHGVIG